VQAEEICSDFCVMRATDRQMQSKGNGNGNGNGNGKRVYKRDTKLRLRMTNDMTKRNLAYQIYDYMTFAPWRAGIPILITERLTLTVGRLRNRARARGNIVTKIAGKRTT
jgi:hypothetical protein